MSKNILGLHYRNTKNIGDRYCHPLDYFHFDRGPDDVVLKGDARKMPDEFNPDCVILGGGAIGRHGPEIFEKYKGAKLVAWGIGTTHPILEDVKSGAHARFGKNFDLWGARDFGGESDYVPCVSCMHPLFDAPVVPQHPVVVYGHAGRGILRDQANALGFPYMENNDPGGFAKAIEHIASGETVITSSFHGAYWATILGRRVSMIPFGSKFFGLKFRPTVVETVSAGVDVAVAYPDALKDCRDITTDFAKKVHSLIWT